jgi:hypothetical protein
VVAQLLVLDWVLTDMKIRSLQSAIAIACVVAFAALVPAAHASPLRWLTLPYHGSLRGSGTLDQDFSGAARFQIPESWRAVKKGRFYNLTPPVVEGCWIKVQVNNAPTLTKATTAAQVAATFPEGFRIAELARGSRAHGSWGIDETTPHADPPGRRVYALGIIHLSGHFYDQLRAVATFVGACSDDVVRNGPTLTALRRIVTGGSFSGASFRGRKLTTWTGR